MTEPGVLSEQPQTRTEWAHSELREAILRGEYGPGEPLVISALAKQMGLSASPLREALRNLASDGFVELQSHGQARVSAVDLPEANEIYDLRLLLEPVALERSVRNGDAEYRSRVDAAWEALTVARVAPPTSHAAFHRALLSACDSAWLLKLSTMLADRAGLMLTVSASEVPDEYDTAEVHRVLKELAVAGDAEAAADELRRHLSKSVLIIQGLATTPDHSNPTDRRGTN